MTNDDPDGAWEELTPREDENGRPLDWQGRFRLCCERVGASTAASLEDVYAQIDADDDTPPAAKPRLHRRAYDLVLEHTRQELIKIGLSMTMDASATGVGSIDADPDTRH